MTNTQFAPGAGPLLWRCAHRFIYGKVEPFYAPAKPFPRAVVRAGCKPASALYYGWLDTFGKEPA